MIALMLGDASDGSVSMLFMESLFFKFDIKPSNPVGLT